MKLNDIENLFLQFLDLYCDSRPLLLGLSGGPDSTALYHLLLAQRRVFRVAHIDHGWRPESRKEADYLAQLCERHGIPYHLSQLTAEEEPSNLEDKARNHRLSFFRKLCSTHQLQGVMLAHHADDQAETVLKRVFEGASLPKLKGLKAKTTIDGVTLLRPLLKLSKKQIKKWLHSHNIASFQDPTNDDPRFLRGRCRRELLPILSQSFGKTVSTSLCRLGEGASELEEYLEIILKPYRQQVIHKEGGVMLDLASQWPESLFLFKAIIRDFFGRERIALPHSVLAAIVFHLRKKSRKTIMRVGKRQIVLDQGIILIEGQIKY